MDTENRIVAKERGELAAVEAARNPLLNLLDFELAQLPQYNFPVVHRFTQGMYARTIFMPKGAKLTSRIHKTDHQYIVSFGDVSVYIEGAGVERIVGPYHGVTRGGTRRILQINEDTVWTTFHPTDLTDLAEIEEQLIHKHDHGSLANAEAAVIALSEGTSP